MELMLKAVSLKKSAILAAVATAGLVLILVGCSSKVLVKKDSCKEVYGGTLLECERVEK